MEIKQLIEKVESSDDFRNWKNKNPDFYMVHVFFMSDQPTHIGYYDEKTDRITTFELKENITINPTSEVFKEKKTIPRLRLDSVNIDKPKALEIAKGTIKEHYPNELLDKEMILLQEQGDDTIYNITYFTKAFKTLNIKIDAEKGMVISHDLNSLVSF